MNIYVASSWRNQLQEEVVRLLRGLNHEVYDFKNPVPQTAFSWADIHPEWVTWTPAEYREGLQHPLAAAGYKSDIDALNKCDACVLVLPSGRSASFELGYAMGAGKLGYVLMCKPQEPELMYREATILISLDEFTKEFSSPKKLEEVRADKRCRKLAVAARYRKALEDIKKEGKVCENFDTCKHESCASSYAAWAIADQALKGA